MRAIKSVDLKLKKDKGGVSMEDEEIMGLAMLASEDDLRSGVIVRNIISGNLGVTIFIEKGLVCVKTTPPRGMGKPRIREWRIKNVEIPLPF